MLGSEIRGSLRVLRPGMSRYSPIMGLLAQQSSLTSNLASKGMDSHPLMYLSLTHIQINVESMFLNIGWAESEVARELFLLNGGKLKVLKPGGLSTQKNS